MNHCNAPGSSSYKAAGRTRYDFVVCVYIFVKLLDECSRRAYFFLLEF